MDMVERVARALCRADLNGDPDKLLTPPAPGDTRRFAWELYIDDAKAAIRAMMEGLEPVAWWYDDDGEIWACAVKPEPIVWDGWTETPLYDLSSLKEAVG